ncbi:hypothetical protein ACLOJK_034374 [Asimina triloba]
MKRAVAKSCRWVSASDLGPRGGAKITIRAVILGGPLVAAGAMRSRLECWWVLDLPQINFVAVDRSMVMIAGPPCLLPNVFAAAAKPIGMGRLPECVPIDLLLMGAGRTEVLLCHRWLLEDFKRAMGFLPEDEVAAGFDGAGFGQRAAEIPYSQPLLAMIRAWGGRNPSSMVSSCYGSSLGR